METALFILAIIAFFTWVAFAYASEKSYGELKESIDKLYNYISSEKRERDFLYGELEDKAEECNKLREQIDKLMK